MTRARILLDLKPALDGYAGIPQESRLLFAGLRSLVDKYDIEGLLQHGSETLFAHILSKDTKLSPDEKLLQHSKSVVSFYGSKRKGFPAKVKKEINKYFTIKRLLWQALKGKPLDLGLFEANLFDDFIWSSFFSKTLNPTQRHIVTTANHRVLRTSRRTLHEVGLRGFSRFHNPRYLSVDTRNYNFFIAHTPFPGRVSPGTNLVIRYHDAVPILMPHTIGDKAFHQASHYYALRDNVESGAWFVCNSEATRGDLLKLFDVDSRTMVIPNIVSGDYFPEASTRTQALKVIQNRIHRETDKPFSKDVNLALVLQESNKSFDYLLMVSTLEPRKNHQLLVAAWERLKYTSMPDLKLVVVGGQGWEYQPILQQLRPWIEQGELFHLSNVPSNELRVLYKHAAATICPSVAEGFDYSGIEAMRCGGLVLASDIPVHREIYEDASVYFDPYDPGHAAEKISHLLGDVGRPEALSIKQAAATVSGKYTPQNILPQWEEFFSRRIEAEKMSKLNIKGN
ncbi:glycosyltransferase family 1 protein [Methyloglobulus sp.]|uniref:glycosyltransferase family 4 protein n=1 Tax=Methyloglobulus sp. TaxID=2518622 RepID=UPI0032B7FA68